MYSCFYASGFFRSNRIKKKKKIKEKKGLYEESDQPRDGNYDSLERYRALFLHLNSQKRWGEESTFRAAELLVDHQS